MQPGVDVEASKNQKDEIQLFGNSLENVSQSAADIQQICKVRNKDIRKVCLPTRHGWVRIMLTLL
jgi:large subunit ribosomal protein L9e